MSTAQWLLSVLIFMTINLVFFLVGLRLRRRRTLVIPPGGAIRAVIVNGLRYDLPAPIPLTPGSDMHLAAIIEEFGP